VGEVRATLLSSPLCACVLQELEGVGIRVNKAPPNIVLKVCSVTVHGSCCGHQLWPFLPAQIKKTGGISFTSTVELTHLDEHQIRNILHFYRVHNADLLIREDITVDDFIDVVEVRSVSCAILLLAIPITSPRLVRFRTG